MSSIPEAVLPLHHRRACLPGKGKCLSCEVPPESSKSAAAMRFPSSPLVQSHYPIVSNAFRVYYLDTGWPVRVAGRRPQARKDRSLQQGRRFAVLGFNTQCGVRRVGTVCSGRDERTPSEVRGPRKRSATGINSGPRPKILGDEVELYRFSLRASRWRRCQGSRELATCPAALEPSGSSFCFGRGCRQTVFLTVQDSATGHRCRIGWH